MELPDDVVGAFTGVATVDGPDGREFELARGWAHRALRVPMTVETRFGVASASKTFTAVIVLRLVERGVLSLTEPVRTWLGDDLPLIAPEVTLEQLLTHTSGIGDYLDEDEYELEDYILEVPVQQLTTAEAFLPILDGRPQREEPGTTFRYNNGGFMVAAVIAERVTGKPYAELLDEEVVKPAGLVATAALRTDSLPADVALGYVFNEGDQTNIFHLPVVPSGDGGAFTNANDTVRFWRALAGGELVSAEHVELMARPRNQVPDEEMQYGLGMWLSWSGKQWIMEGCDVGQSYRSTFDPETGRVATVLSNTAGGAWKMVREFEKLFA